MAFHFQETSFTKLLLFCRRLPKKATAHPLLFPMVDLCNVFGDGNA